jgi:hypothetical protein
MKETITPAGGSAIGQVVSSGPADDAAAPLLPPLEPDRYALGRELAHGGMGRILEARDLRHERTVAIKVLLATRAGAALRFEREIALTARLSHPAIIPLYEAGRLPSGEPCYVMKLVAGRSLDEAVARAETLDDRLALLPHVVALVDAVAHAHGEGIVHRDLKPANVLVGAFGETVVIDWGLAKDLGVPAAPEPEIVVDERDGSVTVAGQAIGTPAYMPPEQARGEPVAAAVDVYAAGALLYHVCAGRAPYRGNGKQVLDELRRGPPPPLAGLVPELPDDLAAIVAKAMARDPAARYRDAAALAADLRAFMRGARVSARRYTAAHLLARWLHRYRRTIAAALVVAAALAASAALGIGRIVAARDRADAAHAVAEAERAAAETHRDAAAALAGYVVGDVRAQLGRLGRPDLLARVDAALDAHHAP